MSTVFLVAYHPIFRAALAQVIQDQCPHTLHVVGESGWAREELAAVAAAQPDVVVVVVGLDVSGELASVSDIRSLAPGCRVLVIDSLGSVDDYPAGDWCDADVLLHPEHLVSELAPAIQGLAARSRRAAAQPAAGRGCVPLMRPP